MADFVIRKGMDVPLAGAPASEVSDAGPAGTVAVCPGEVDGLRPRLLVREGDAVRRGTPVLEDKARPAFRLCAPAAGVVEAVVYGPRRSIERIVVRTGGAEGAEPFRRYDLGELRKAPAAELLELLQASGLLALIRRRPFSRTADPAVRPKSIFVNAMNTAPFRTDAAAAAQGHEAAFQAGLYALGRLTDGLVHLVLDGNRDGQPEVFSRADAVELHRFRGPHPAGNPSVHIHHLDPIRPGDTVWTVTAPDLTLIGRLLIEGELPADRVVALGGPGARPDACRHYRMPLGAALGGLMAGALREGEVRLLNGDALAGATLPADGYLPLLARGFTALPEDRARRFMGWMTPGGDRFSHSPTFFSAWRRRAAPWALGTNRNGSLRAMVLTGLYDRYLPLDLMADYLVRAVLANDTVEAVELGLLETDPEDFALPAFVCPSKTDLVGIVRRGLKAVEDEGL